MTRLVLRLELETLPNGRNESADQVIDLGLLAPSLSPAEIGALVLAWAPEASEGLMRRVLEAERKEKT